MAVFINTCLFRSSELAKKIREYAKRYGKDAAFEVLAKFDEPDFAPALEKCKSPLKKCRTAFHSPVWLAEPSAPKGSKEYERTMEMNRETAKFAEAYGCEHLVWHLNNCKVDPKNKEKMLWDALDNLDEIKKMFSFCDVYVENSGTLFDSSLLLGQSEFTEIAQHQKWQVLVDLGHANANGWDIYKLMDDLKGQIKALHIHNNFGRKDLHNRIHEGNLDVIDILTKAKNIIPDAKWIIEYIHPEKEGAPLMEDFDEIIELKNRK